MRTPLARGAFPLMLVAVACCAPAASGPAPLASAREPASPQLRARMRDHDVHGDAMRDAVARGELGVARQEAEFLVALGGDRAIDAPWRDRLEAMRVAAARVAEATNIPEASVGLGAVARTCGECHAQLGGPRPAVAALPEPGPDVGSRMKRHGWAVARMWDGLVVPSTPAWKAGARALSDAPLQPVLITPNQSAAAEVVRFQSTIHDLAGKAFAAGSGSERSAIYGALMTTCSDCHARLGGGPGARGSTR